MVQRRTVSHPDMGIVGATTDSFILFENGAMRNRLVLPGLSNAADHAVQARPVRSPLSSSKLESHLARPIRRGTVRRDRNVGIRSRLPVRSSPKSSVRRR